MRIKSLAVVLLALTLALPASALTTRYADFDQTTGSNDGTSEANAWQSWAAVVSGIAVGDRVCVQQVCDTPNTDPPCTLARHETGATFTTDADADDNIVLEGYKTTCGDGGDDDRNNFFQSGSVTISTATGYLVRFFDFTGDPGAGAQLLTAGNAERFRCSQCYFADTNTAKTVPVLNLNDERMIDQSKIVVPANGQAAALKDAGIITGSTVDMTASGANGIEFTNNWSQYGHVSWTIIFGSGSGKALWGPAFSDADLSKARFFSHNTIYNVGTAIEFAGIGSAGSDAHEVVVNNLIWNVDKAVDNNGSFTAGATIMYNGTGSCTTACYEGWGDQLVNIGATTITSDPFEDAASGDFRIKATATEVQNVALSVSGATARHLGAVQAVAPAAAGRPKIW